MTRKYREINSDWMGPRHTPATAIERTTHRLLFVKYDYAARDRYYFQHIAQIMDEASVVIIPDQIVDDSIASCGLNNWLPEAITVCVLRGIL